MDDRQIIDGLWARRETAVEALRAKFGKQLLQTAYNILGDRLDAEEAVSDTYLAVWNAIPPARPDPLAAFVYRTGRNTALKLLRHHSAQKRDGRYDVALEELAGILPAGTLEQQLQARELGRTINAFLGTLDSDSRRLFLRRYWFGDSIRDLSCYTGLSENLLSVRLHRLRSKLKDYLYKEGFWDET